MLEVEGVRAGDVDDVDVGVGHQRVVRRVGAGVVVAVARGRSASADSSEREPTAASTASGHGAEVGGEVAGDACPVARMPQRVAMVAPCSAGSRDAPQANDIAVIPRVDSRPRVPSTGSTQGETPDGRRARTAEPRREAVPGLGERDREILEFERQWWKYAGAKETAIRESFDMSATRYYQVLNALIDRPEALVADPLLVRRLRRMRAERQRARSARRLGLRGLRWTAGATSAGWSSPRR